MARIHFVGGEKGGVGKSVLARLLVQYYIDSQQPFQAFDTDLSHGALMRYYSEFSTPIDFTSFENADRVIEVAVEQDKDVIVDLAAQSARPFDRWVKAGDVFSLAGNVGLEIVYWHVMEDGNDSLMLLDRLLDAYGLNPYFVIVKNFGRGVSFDLFDQSETREKAERIGADVIDLPALEPSTMLKIDSTGASLWAAANNTDPSVGPTLGLMERQRVKVWVGQAYQQMKQIFDELETD